MVIPSFFAVVAVIHLFHHHHHHLRHSHRNCVPREEYIRIEIELLIELIFVRYFFYSFYAASFSLGLRFSLSSFLSCFPVEAFPQRLGIKYFIFLWRGDFAFYSFDLSYLWTPSCHGHLHPHSLITLSLRFGFAIGSTETILNSGMAANMLKLNAKLLEKIRKIVIIKQKNFPTVLYFKNSFSFYFIHFLYYIYY